MHVCIMCIGVCIHMCVCIHIHFHIHITLYYIHINFHIHIIFIFIGISYSFIFIFISMHSRLVYTTYLKLWRNDGPQLSGLVGDPAHPAHVLGNRISHHGLYPSWLNVYITTWKDPPFSSWDYVTMSTGPWLQQLFLNVYQARYISKPQCIGEKMIPELIIHLG